MKRLVSILGCLLIAQAVLLAGGRLPKSPDYGKYDAEFDKVFMDMSLLRSTDELHSLVVLKDGKLIYDRHDPAHSMTGRHILWSASKSFTSLAVGFAIQDGLLSLEDKVVSFFGADVLPEKISPWLEQMTLRNMLIMASGFEKDYIGETRGWAVKEPTKTILNTPVVYEPGSRYQYNSMNTYLAGVIVSKVTGMDLGEYLEKKLFKPLGIKDWYWEKSAEGYCCGGWGLYLSPESLAKVGQFLLQEGNWKNRQLLDASYIREATSSHILQYDKSRLNASQIKALPRDEGKQGYGYQFWRLTHNAYKMSGAHCQWVIVIPEKDAVVVFTSSCTKSQGMTESIWNHIYPAL